MDGRNRGYGSAEGEYVTVVVVGGSVVLVLVGMVVVVVGNGVVVDEGLMYRGTELVLLRYRGDS